MALTKAQLVDMNANELILDLDADTSLHASTDDQIDIKIGGADDFTFTANTFTALAGSSIVVPASGLTIGSTAVTSTAAELNLIDGGASTGTTAVADADGIITNDGGTMRLTTAATFKTYFQEGISTAYDDLTAGDAAVNITTSSGNITIDAAANDSDIIFKGTDNSADITMLTLDGSAAGDATFNNQIIVGDGKLVLNSTAVTSTAAELNLLDGVSGLVQADLTKLAALDATAAEINFIDGGATIGTTAVADADGIIHNDGGTMKVTTAATFKTYFQEGISQAYDDFTIGDAAVLITTSSGNITVDAAANDSDIILKGTDGGVDTTFLTIDGSAAGDATFNNQIIVGDGKLVLGSTAVTSTAAELNLLDNVSGLVQADLTKLAAIDSTAAEINLIDGGTARGTTAVATGDGILINDGGTMRMTNVDTVSTYFAGHNVGGGNIVTTGALDSGSITSGFGAIDNGTSNIRSATITAETAFVPDAANGATLGTASLEFADMYLHDGGVVYFGADQDVELAHVADVGLTLKTATTSDDTKATLTLQTGDTDIAANDVLGQLHFQAPDEGAGTDAILVAAGIAAISEGDFSASNNATKLSFQTGASEAASEKMSLSSAGLLTVADDIVFKDGGTIGVASAVDAMTVSSGGIVTFKDDILIKNGGTIGSASDADAMSIASGGAVTFTQTPVFPDGSLALADLDIDGGTDIGAAIVDADLFIVDDGAGGTNRKTTASRIKTYVGEGLFTKITGTTISAGGSVTIQNCFNSTFRNYFITFERIKCATDGANLELDPIDTNGNQTDEHCYQGLFMGKAQFSNNWSEDNGASYTLMENQGNATGEHFSGFMYAFNPNQAGSSQFSVTWQGFSIHNGAADRNGVTWGGGKTATNTSAYTGFILRMTSGNINSGTVAVYGINDPT